MATKKLQILGSLSGEVQGAVRYDTEQNIEGFDKLTANKNIGAISYAVEQDYLSADDKLMAQQNIGAVGYNDLQYLHPREMSMARNNICVAGFDEIYKTELKLLFTWDGIIGNRDTFEYNGNVYCKVTDTIPNYMSLSSIKSTISNDEIEVYYQNVGVANVYIVGSGFVIEKAGYHKIGMYDFTAPSAGIYFLSGNGDGTGLYQKSLEITTCGTEALRYTWDGNIDGKESFAYSDTINYYKVSDDIVDFEVVSKAVARHSNGGAYNNNDSVIIEGTNCYVINFCSIVVTQAGECFIPFSSFPQYNKTDISFTVPSVGVYFERYLDAQNYYTSDLTLFVNGRHGIYLNSENNNFVVSATNDGAITTENKNGEIVEMAKKTYVDECNDAISHLNNLVGDDPVSVQITTAIATKIDVPESARVGQVLSVKSIDANGNIAWEAVNPETVEGSVPTDPSFSEEGVAADAKVTGDRLSTIESQIADLLYTEIAITSFTNNIGTVEKGSNVSSVTLSWKTNKTPTILTLDGESMDASSTSITANNLSISSDKTWTLKATDERGATSEKTTKITFLNGVYYGAVNSSTTIDNSTIAGLTKNLQSTKSITFTTNANAGQHIVFALPESYGTPAFNVGGFDGGFSLHSTFNFKNSSGYETQYQVWISDNTGLGETTVKVS